MYFDIERRLSRPKSLQHSVRSSNFALSLIVHSLAAKWKEVVRRRQQRVTSPYRRRRKWKDNGDKKGADVSFYDAAGSSHTYPIHSYSHREVVLVEGEAV